MSAAFPSDVVNQAVQHIGGFNNQGPIAGVPPNFDGTPIGIAAGQVYASVVQTVGRQFGWDFSRNIFLLVATANPAPLGWTSEYVYPPMGVQVRYVVPQTIDLNNPLPIRWTVGNTLNAGVPTKVIWTNQAGASAVVSNLPPESLWDALFLEEVVRLLGSVLAKAIEGKPETAHDLLQEAQGFGQINEGRSG